MGYKVLARFCRENRLTETHKDGILLGMHIMGLQSEKWFDNEEHAESYRMDKWDEGGFSGWREIYQHTKGFLEAEQPLEDEGSDEPDHYEADMREIYGSKEKEEEEEWYEEENDVSDIELTDDETEEEFEIVDNEDEYDGTEWMTHMYENVQYLVGPNPHQKGNSDEKVVLETEDYQPVGVFENGKIIFEDDDRVCEHFDRVRESTVPEDQKEAMELITEFINDNYKGYTLYTYQESHADRLPSMICVDQKSREEGPDRSMWFHFGGVHAGAVDTTKCLSVLGKNMGEVMKNIEKIM